MADQTAVAVKMKKKITPRQVAADVKPLKGSTTVEKLLIFRIKWGLSGKLIRVCAPPAFYIGHLLDKPLILPPGAFNQIAQQDGKRRIQLAQSLPVRKLREDGESLIN